MMVVGTIFTANLFAPSLSREPNETEIVRYWSDEITLSSKTIAEVFQTTNRTKNYRISRKLLYVYSRIIKIYIL